MDEFFDKLVNDMLDSAMSAIGAEITNKVVEYVDEACKGDEDLENRKYLLFKKCLESLEKYIDNTYGGEMKVSDG